MLQIVPFNYTDNMRLLTELAKLWLEAFPNGDKNPLDEIRQCLNAERLAFAALDGEAAVGFAGAIPQYGITGWELHPFIVAEAYQGRGIGSQLLQVMEEAVRKIGGITTYLGCDDVDGTTSLSNCDLYENTFAKIKDIQTLTAKRHPYEFYLKNGYSITGVTPDANGVGKPDIWLSKKLVNI